MTSYAMANTIRSRFATQVETAESVAVLYDNEPQDPPDDEQWIRFSILDGRTNQAEMGGNQTTYRTSGVAIAQIFAPMQAGDGAARELADVIVAAFRAVTVSGVVFRAPSVGPVGAEGKWWQLNVSCDFYYDELIS
ncbi:MAG: hypothetical protein GY856_36760 [bacterium]|nr:hypothetical protein [bacterium]